MPNLRWNTTFATVGFPCWAGGGLAADSPRSPRIRRARRGFAALAADSPRSPRDSPRSPPARIRRTRSASGEDADCRTERERAVHGRSGGLTASPPAERERRAVDFPNWSRPPCVAGSHSSEHDKDDRSPNLQGSDRGIPGTRCDAPLPCAGPQTCTRTARRSVRIPSGCGHQSTTNSRQPSSVRGQRNASSAGPDADRLRSQFLSWSPAQAPQYGALAFGCPHSRRAGPHCRISSCPRTLRRPVAVSPQPCRPWRPREAYRAAAPRRPRIDRSAARRMRPSAARPSR